MAELSSPDANEEQTQRSFLLAFVSSLAILLLAQAWWIDSPPKVLTAQRTTASIMTILAVLLYAAPRWPTQRLGQVLMASLLIHFSFVAWHTAGIHSTALDWIILIPTATLLFSIRITQFWSICSVLLFAALGISHWLYGQPSPVPDATYSAWSVLNSAGITLSLACHLIFYDRVNERQMTQLLAKKTNLEQAQQLLIKTQAHKDEFIAVVSHEIRTPMNAVLGFSSLIKEQANASTQKIVDHIQISSHQLLGIISDILDFSQLQANKVELFPQAITPQCLLVQARNRALTKLQAKQLSMDIVSHGTIPNTIYADEFRLSQVLDQLIDNAIKFSQQGHIELRLRQESNQLWIDVKDQGIGLDQSDCEKIFSDFQHANIQVQRRYGGTGLGLAICKHIMALHHGKIQAQSNVDRGAVFSLSLPLSMETNQPQTAISIAKTQSSDDSSWQHRFKRLIKGTVLNDLKDRTSIFMTTLIMISFNLIYYYAIAPFPEAKQTETALPTLYLIAAWWLYRGASLKHVLNFVIAVSLIGITYLCIYSGGIFSPVMTWFNLAVVAALYLGSSSSKFWWIGGTLAIQCVLAVGTYTHLWPSDTSSAALNGQWSFSGHFSLLIFLTLVPLTYKLVRQHTQSELISSNQRLADISKDLLHQQYLKDQFVSTISHALRTPLNTIIGFCDLLRDDIQYKQGMLELQSMMSQSARHLLTVINDILDRSQLTSGQLKLKKEPFDLPQTIRNAFQMFNASRTNTQVDLQLDLQGLPQWVLGDAQRLTQIMVNLLNNAIKFTPQGFIRLTAYAVDHAIRFEVQDTGNGIPADRMNHIFDQYEQVNVATHRKKGHGLGLSITKHLIEAQKGWISVQSQVNRGTTFTFEIQFPATQASMASPSITQTVHSTQQHLHILIVDDQPLNRLLARQVLQRQWSDIVLTEASDGVQAINQLRSQPVDLILMDVLMPEMDGISATQHIRTQLPDALARTPILGLTANAYEINRKQCLEAGMNDIIYKPFNREQLIHTIQQLAGG